MSVLKVATGAQTIIQWLSIVVLKNNDRNISCLYKCFLNCKDGGGKVDEIGIYFSYSAGKK